MDFDGVLNTYTGWQGPSELFEPRPGVQVFLQTLHDLYYEVVIHTTRNANKVADWLEAHDCYWDVVTNTKMPAHAYIDDRAVRFRGDFAEALRDLQHEPHWKRQSNLAPQRGYPHDHTYQMDISGEWLDYVAGYLQEQGCFRCEIIAVEKLPDNKIRLDMRRVP